MVSARGIHADDVHVRLRQALGPAEAIELTAVIDAYRAAAPELAIRNGLEHRVSDHVMLDCASTSALAFRRAHLLEHDDRTIDAIDAHVPVVVRADDHGLAAKLRERGRTASSEGVYKLVRDPVPLADPVTPSLPVRELGIGDAAAMDDIIVDSFGLPASLRGWFGSLVGREGWRHFGAVDGDQVVAVGSMYRRKDRVWLGNGATRTSHRRRGLQRAVIEARIRAALDADVAQLVVETETATGMANDPSFVNCHRAGFTVAYERRAFVTPPHD